MAKKKPGQPNKTAEGKKSVLKFVRNRESENERFHKAHVIAVREGSAATSEPRQHDVVCQLLKQNFEGIDALNSTQQTLVNAVNNLIEDAAYHRSLFAELTKEVAKLRDDLARQGLVLP